MTLAEKILSLRTQRGMSQDDLAEKLEVSRQSVSKWETAQSTPDLDKIIRLADLFGVSVDELVRDGKAPQPPEPSQPQVVYVEREGKRESLTAVQIIGVILEVVGAALAILGIMSAPVLVFAALALVVLGLPLLLAKKHPWLVMGWLAVGLSCLALNPYTSVSPWGLIGGLRRLYYYITIPGIRYPSTVFAIAVGIIRGLLILVLAFFTWRAWKKKKSLEKDG